eukprot:NODE_697_length_4659_cov_0.783991.p2 type:complete len:386 gc:universal NODE_697_length_4659_cov_0.783991:4120-2963(-)
MSPDSYAVQVYDFSNYDGIDECEVLFNGVVYKLNQEELLILRCTCVENNKRRSVVKFLTRSFSQTYSSEMSQEFMGWDTNNTRDGQWKNFIGPEEARIFEFKDDIFLYYSMTNPLPQFPMRGIEIIKLKDALSQNYAKSKSKTFLQTNVFGASPKVEKNWVFIDNGTDLIVLYKMNPYILGDISNSTFNARIKRQYNCFHPEDEVHFSSNAIKIIQDNQPEYMVAFNNRPIEDSSKYLSHLAFFQAEAPFELKRITRNTIDFGIEYNKLIYFDGITIQGKNELHTDSLDDVILLSGGIDDKNVFKIQIYLRDLMELPSKSCTAENGEWAYFGYPESKRTHQLSGSSMIILFVMGIAIFGLFVRKFYIKFFSSEAIQYKKIRESEC